MDDNERPEIQIRITPRARAAIEELQSTIAAHFPQATFATDPGYDPAGIYLEVTVDIDDTDEVYDVVSDRLLDIQVEESIPLYLTVQRPIERVLAEFRTRRERSVPSAISNRIVIVQDPAVHWGQAVVAGTWIPVALVFAFLSHTPDVDTLLTEYPGLTIDDVKACFAYAQSLAANAPRLEELALPGSRLDASA